VASDGGLRPRGNSTFDNQAGGVFDIQGDLFSVSRENTGNTITNAGILRKSAGAGSNSINPVVPVTNLSGGVIDVQTGTLIIGSLSHSTGALIQGAGTLEIGTVTTFEGDVAPGTSPGTLNITGDVPQGRQSTVNVELNGTAVGAEYDQLNVSGAVTLNGNLDITAGFAPSAGTRFTVLTFGSRTGSFANINGLDLGGGITLQPQWNANSLELVATGTGPTPNDIVFWSDSGGGISTGIFGVNGDGSNLVQIRDPGADVASRIFPRWSPDRSRIAFGHSTSGATNELYVMSAAGDEIQQVVNGTIALYPKWSPSGTHLGFVCIGGVPEDLCVIPDVDVPIADIPVNGHINVTALAPADWRNGSGTGMWDPQTDGRVVFARDSVNISKFFTANHDGGNMLELTAPLDAGAGPLRVFGPMDWSLDGSEMVFAAADPQNNEHLYIMNSDGTNLRTLTSGAVFDDAPLFSPDGSQILFGRQETTNYTYDLWLINSDGSNPHQITADAVIADFDLNALGYDWSPDGTEIVLNGADNSNGWVHVYVVPSTVTAATYFAQRRLVGRDADVASWLWEVQPAWRP